VNVLFAALALPYPPMNGHRLRTWAMVRALAEDGHQVSVVSFAEPDEMQADLRPLREICRDVDLVPAPTASGGGSLEALRRLGGLAMPMPYGAWKFQSRGFTARLQHHLRQRRFDAVICDGVYNMQNMPPGLVVPVLLNKDDVAHVIIRRYLALETHPLRRFYGRLELAKVERWEQRTMRATRGVLACSDSDRSLLRRLCPSAVIHVVPNVVDTDHYVPRPDADPATVLYQGGMDWHPNRDAVEYFAREILPELRRLAPSVRFRVAGRDPSSEFRRRFADVPGVEFSGTVADMRDEIARATVCVVPLRIGSGTRLKILEAGAMAKAIVSTTLGAEGLELRDGEDIALADHPHAFARAVAGLLADPVRRDELGRAARLAIQKRYSLSVFQTAMREAMAR
jgi:glycosyltransferase involved in cell wall biosynthesis